MKRASLRGQMAVQCIRGFTATPRGRTYATGMTSESEGIPVEVPKRVYKRETGT
jgi:hypothetical protein